MYRNCKFCHGRGCIACEGEKEKDESLYPEPMFVADPSNEHDMKLLKQFFGKEAVEKAFSEDGDGMRELAINAAAAQLLQSAREVRNNQQGNAPDENEGGCISSSE
jgi:hypothetical protein